MNPYHQFVDSFARLVHEGRTLPLGGFERAARPALAADAPKALIFSPHPDDECIIGGMALRLFREAGFRIVNVAVTQGSRKDRQAARWEELTAACDHLGFELVQTAPGGLERINAATREKDPAHWRGCVERIARIIADERPSVAFFPHDTDWNSTHVGTHHLVADALREQGAGFRCHAIETEFWGAMATPNLAVESSVQDIGDMLAALSFHVGEVQRNPYHLLMPAWMQDNVRRGAEVVGGQGGAAPDFTFCTLYRLRRWENGGFMHVYEGGRHLGVGTNAGEALTW